MAFGDDVDAPFADGFSWSFFPWAGRRISFRGGIAGEF
jgi:hypothetical protein